PAPRRAVSAGRVARRRARRGRATAARRRAARPARHDGDAAPHESARAGHVARGRAVLRSGRRRQATSRQDPHRGAARRARRGGAQARIVVSAHDQFGNPTSADRSRATIDGEPAPLRMTAGGLGILIVPPPPYYDGKDRLTVEVTLDGARALQDVLLTGGSPTT